MNRLIISLALLGIFLGAGFLGTSYANNTTDRIYHELSVGTKLMKTGDHQAAREHCIKAEKIYTENENFMTIFYNRDDLNYMGEILSSAVDLAHKDSQQDFLSTCSLAQTALVHMKNGGIF